MTGSIRFFLGVASGIVLAFLPQAVLHLRAAYADLHGEQAAPGSARAHTEERFSFTARAPVEQVFPLFGADKERVWAPGWNPRFIHPNPAADSQGMVFTVAHGHLASVWVNTAFDPKSGLVQYVYTIPQHLVTVITLNVMADGNQTHVDVAYDRTSLRADADGHVLDMAKQDRNAGPEWDKQINDYLASLAAKIPRSQ
jgi:hypothetical protein